MLKCEINMSKVLKDRLFNEMKYTFTQVISQIIALLVFTNPMHSSYITCKGTPKSHSPYSPSKVVLLL